MNRHAAKLWLAPLLGGMMLASTACGSVLGCTAAATGATPAPLAVPVEVARAQTGNISQVFTYAGTLQAKDTTQIVPLVAGRVLTVSVDVGDVVKAGDPIAVLEPDVYQEQLRQAESGLKAAQGKLAAMRIGSRPEEIAAAQASVRAAQVAIDAVTTPTDDQRTLAAATMASTEAALRVAQYNYDKIAYLAQVSQTPQALALQQATIAYQSAVAAYDLTIKPTDGQLAPLQNDLAQAQLKLALTVQPYIDTDFVQAQAAVDQAQAAVDLAKTQLSYTTIFAPYDGTISELYITKGAVTGPSAPAATLLSSSKEVVLNVEEARIGRIKAGQNAALRVPAYPGRDFGALVTLIAPMADPQTHTFLVKVTPGEDSGLLRPGMYADVSILAGEKQNALLVPADAVTQVGGQPTVYVVKGSTVEQRQVVTGMADQSNVEILAGLQAGDMVVTKRGITLTNGMPVLVARGS